MKITEHFMVQKKATSSDVLNEKDSLVIASRQLPTYFGGLGQYQRSLGEHLFGNFGILGIFISEQSRLSQGASTFKTDGWKFVLLDEFRRWRLGRSFCSRCASRPVLHNVLETVVAVRWSRSIEAALPRNLKAIHFVGTGWDFLGFAFLQVARRQGICFTILPAVHPGQWGDDLIDIRFYQAANKVFVLSDHEKHWLMKKGLAENKIVRTCLPPMCATTGDGIAFREKHRLVDCPIVLFLGRHDEGKGYPALLEAWQQVRIRYPSACLVTIGPQESAVIDVGDREQSEILDLGIVSEEDKADALAACDVFCLPSAHESFGIVYLEAWFYSKPVICGTAPACRELIRDGETGLWSSQEVGPLSEAICRLLDDPALAREMGRKGKQEQMETYTWDKIGRLHLEEFYRPVGE